MELKYIRVRRQSNHPFFWPGADAQSSRGASAAQEPAPNNGPYISACCPILDYPTGYCAMYRAPGAISKGTLSAIHPRLAYRYRRTRIEIVRF